MAEEHDDGYTGAATLTVGGRDLPVRVVLDARHEPQDGKLHWFGRLTLEDGPLSGAELAGPIELRTSGGSAPARLGDLDPWGRYRVSGVGTPPFTIPEPALED